MLSDTNSNDLTSVAPSLVATDSTQLFLYSLIAYVLIIGVVVWLSNFLLLKLNNTHNPTKRTVIAHSIVSAKPPFIVFATSIFIRHCFEISNISNSQHFVVRFFIDHVVFMAALFSFLWLVHRATNSFREEMIRRFKFEEVNSTTLDKNSQKTKIDAIGKFIIGGWTILSGIMLLNHFGVPASSILAFGGFGTVVIGFAARDIISDVISALLIYADNTFDLEEWVRIDNPSVEGVIEHIGWRVTCIRTFNNTPVYIPNSVLGKSMIQNVSRRDAMRIKEHITVEVKSASKLPSIIKEIKQSVFNNHDGIDLDRPVVVSLSSYKGSVCWLYVSAHTKSTDMSGYYGIKQDVLLKINTILDANDVSHESPNQILNSD
ncbi:conserved membrane hypothetical protein [Vibrio chagasii]|nr:conserved membrane hypothetical protein [Vibrio chagasii]CAH7321306.1 conserved membrane hypothetical protein [Vibrio chagasii]